MDPISIAGIVVSAIAAASAYASQRAAARASTINTNTTSRVDMEKEAYNRARAFDTETIRRQEVEISELRDNEERLKVEIKALRVRVARLERGIPTASEELINERFEDDNPFSQ